MAFYRIKDAAEKIGVQPHVLRFWESQFPSIKPPKTTRGQRLYSEEDVGNFPKIKVLLYNEGFSIPGAKKVLKDQKALDSKHQQEQRSRDVDGSQASEPTIQQLPLQQSLERVLDRAERAVQSSFEKSLFSDILRELKELRSFVRAN